MAAINDTNMKNNQIVPIASMCKEGQIITESSSDDNADYIPDTHHEEEDQPDNSEV